MADNTPDIKKFIENISFEKLEEKIQEIHSALSFEQQYKLIRDLIDQFGSQHWIYRRKASLALTTIRKNVLKPLISAITTTENLDIIYWSIRTMVAVEDFEILEVFTRFIQTGNQKVRFYTILNLPQIKNPLKLEILIKALSDPVWNHRKFAADGIMQMGMNAVKILNQYYKDSPFEQKYWILKCLGTILGDKGIEPFRKFMEKGDRDSKYFSMTALAATREEKAIPLLLRNLDDADLYTRIQAAAYLESFGEKAIPFLEEVSAYNLKPETKQILCKIIARILHDEAVPLFRKMLGKLRSDSPREEKILIVEALGETGSREGVKLLLELLADDSWLVKIEVVRAAGFIANLIPEETVSLLSAYFAAENEEICPWILKIAEEAALPFLEIYQNYYKVRSQAIRLNIIQSISQLPQSRFSNRLQELLLSALADPYWPIRQKSSEILINLGSMVIFPLLELAAKKKDRDTCYWAQLTLQRINPEGNRALTNFLRENGLKDLVELSQPAASETKRDSLAEMKSVADTGPVQPGVPGPILPESGMMDSSQFDGTSSTSFGSTYTDRQVRQFLHDLEYSDFEEVRLMSLQSLSKIKLDKKHLKSIKKVVKKIYSTATPEMKRSLDEAINVIFPPNQ
ncbi:MAG: HEAT repeat domain-containing protein [Candidatus Wallbacteria bacterium]|nr:HEAT repeat domain-containing protein [Candidatus Wallbacteria bacterium]